ncbi:IS110 family transposase [Streptomyces lasalocidi]|uniref:IS110 family transposase n=1 Tax=Streptomyces lasalocidi TaxID=324833 RepID=A0A4U5W4B8_STRLS|nr:IS110 family transposase [Streptomyces lasalocidi]TKS96237.1 IS110 family transposase [Streptomyces lasalocidi]
MSVRRRVARKIDAANRSARPKKIDNGEAAILTALGDTLDLADEARWPVGISGTSTATVLAWLAVHGWQTVHALRRTVNRMFGAYRGEAETDLGCLCHRRNTPSSAGLCRA